MTARFCLTQDTSSNIYRLADASEDIIATHQVTVLLAPGTDRITIYRDPETTLNLSTPFIELKRLVTGWDSLKVLMSDGECLSLNQHNFNKDGYPVRNFTDLFILKKIKDARDLERTFSTGDLIPSRRSASPDSLPLITMQCSASFIETLVGKENRISDFRLSYKLKIAIRPNKITKGSFYNSMVYRFNAIGDCEAIGMDEIYKIKENDFAFRISYSKKTVFLYTGNNSVADAEEILRQLENCGQEDFYIKPEFNPSVDTYGYIEPVIKLK